MMSTVGARVEMGARYRGSACPGRHMGSGKRGRPAAAPCRCRSASAGSPGKRRHLLKTEGSTAKRLGFRPGCAAVAMSRKLRFGAMTVGWAKAHLRAVPTWKGPMWARFALPTLLIGFLESLNAFR